MQNPDSNPQIPDAVSFADLTNFLSDKSHFPLSDFMPEVNFGGDEGGVCDLQFAVMQLIQRSTTGCNVLQLLSTSIHLILEVEHHFSEQLRRCEADLPPFDTAPQEEKAIITRILRGLLMSLRTSSSLTEELFSFLMQSFGMRRLDSIRDRITSDITPSELRSQLLISDELLSSLQLDRGPVTQYLDRAVNTL